MKQTAELKTAVQKSINAFFKALADGKVNAADFQYFFTPLLAWPEAVKDLTFSQEARVATNEEVEQLFYPTDDLDGLSPEDAYDVNNILKGAYCVVRLATRTAYEKGLEDGKELSS